MYGLESSSSFKDNESPFFSVGAINKRAETNWLLTDVEMFTFPPSKSFPLIDNGGKPSFSK